EPIKPLPPKMTSFMLFLLKKADGEGIRCMSRRRGFRYESYPRKSQSEWIRPPESRPAQGATDPRHYAPHDLGSPTKTVWDRHLAGLTGPKPVPQEWFCERLLSTPPP